MKDIPQPKIVNCERRDQVAAGAEPVRDVAPERRIIPRRKKSQIAERRREAMAKSEIMLGRPKEFSPEIGQLIIRRVQSGDHYDQLIKDGLINSYWNLCLWKQQDVEFREALEKAQEERAELWADQLIAIADNKRLDPNDRRVRIDTRWKVISSLLPKRYGVKQQVDITQNINVAVVHAEQLMQLTKAARETTQQIEDNSLIEGEVIK